MKRHAFGGPLHPRLTLERSRIAARFTNVGLSTDLPELHGQVPRSAEFKP
jgi:hypothetical protein